MKKIFFIILLLSSFLNASMLFDKSYPLCIENFYIQSGRVFYLKSSDNTWSSTSTDYQVKNIYSGYIYDLNNSSCLPEPYMILGMDVKDWHFLNALTGVFFGLIILLFSIYIFINVGRGHK